MRTRLRERTGHSTALQEAVVRWLCIHPECRTVALFAPLPGEPDLLPLVGARPERRWLLPKVRGEVLDFHEVADPQDGLVTGAFGIREPRCDSAPVPIREIDVFLCPGLAFDRSGNRLGRGRGFYDRILEMARHDARKLGVCFPFQLVDDTFPEAHDIRMDEVITPSQAD